MAFSEQRGGGAIDVQRKGGHILGEELISALKSIIVSIILRYVALSSTLPGHCSWHSWRPPSSPPPLRPLPNLPQGPLLRCAHVNNGLSNPVLIAVLIPPRRSAPSQPGCQALLCRAALQERAWAAAPTLLPLTVPHPHPCLSLLPFTLLYLPLLLPRWWWW